MIKEGDIVITKSGFWIGVAGTAHQMLGFDYEVKWFADLQRSRLANFATGADARVLRLYDTDR